MKNYQNTNKHNNPEIYYYLSKTNHYEILDINAAASQQQIKKAYKKLALKFHPDKNSHPSSKQVFNKITNSYNTLLSKNNTSKLTSNTSNNNNYANNSTNQNKNYQNFNNYFNKNTQNKFNFNFQKQFQKKYEKYKAQWQQSQKRYQKQNPKQKQTKFNDKNKDKSSQKKQYQNNKKFDPFKYKQAFKNRNANNFKDNNNKSNKQQTFYQKFKRQQNQWTYQEKQQTWGSFKAKYQAKMKKQKPKQQQKQQSQQDQRQRNQFSKKQSNPKKGQRMQYKPKTYIQRNFFWTIALIFLMGAIFYLGPRQSKILYTFKQGNGFTIPLQTSHFNLKFYVKPQFMEKVDKDKIIMIVQKQINTDFIKKLSGLCQKSINNKRSLQRSAMKFQGSIKQEIMNKANVVDMKFCDQLSYFRQKDSQYFSQLFSK